MSEQSIFQDGTPPVPEPIIQSNEQVVSTELQEFIGTGKKYATVDLALNSIPHAQKHIQTLSEQLEATKKELENRKTTEELLNEIKSKSQPTGETPAGLDADSVAQVVKAVLSRSEQEKSSKQNTDIVIMKLTEQYGDKAETEFIRIASEAGLTIPMLNQLAATSPQAVLKLAGIGEKKEVIAPSSKGTLNTESWRQTVPQNEVSAKVPPGASTRDMVSAWKNAKVNAEKNPNL